ncbi:hypothetical protein [Rhizobium sp. BK060]|uniref:hypothetical protein n=1 Tax=Rhizobium sp. BK060 TaxID=2587096 RepID=UPI001609741B|nr:hypothetical protein [Rhizobium sp. BK060]MBB3396841.1 hypothetical protein [Rhizobium sp. BK060]
MIEEVYAAIKRHEAPSPLPRVVGIELNGVAEQLADGAGAWRSCSGCHNLNEGHPTGEWSDVLKCHLGMGCFECGGIGAVWDNTDYSDYGREQPADQMAGVVGAIVAERYRQIAKGYDDAHDDKHRGGEIIWAEWGVIARLNDAMNTSAGSVEHYKRLLTQAAAQIVAEIKRVDRAAAMSEGGNNG